MYYIFEISALHFKHFEKPTKCFTNIEIDYK